MYPLLPVVGNTGVRSLKTPSPTALPLYSPTGNTEGECKCIPTHTNNTAGLVKRGVKNYQCTVTIVAPNPYSRKEAS